MGNKTRRIALCGLLGALALTLSALEGMLPPIPGVPPGAKPGLSNLVTMFAAGTLGLPAALAVALIKGVFALLTRGVTAGVMSLAGGVLSTLVMFLVYRRTKLSFLFVGVSGALAHNAAQLAVALVLTGYAAVFYAPALLLMSVLTGLCTGFVLQLLMPVLQRVLRHFNLN